MRTFAQRPKAPQQTTPATSTMPGRAPFGQSDAVNSILRVQRTIGNQAVQRPLEDKPDGFGTRGPDSVDTSPPGVGSGLHFAFSRIPITAPPVQPRLTISSPGDPFEREADSVADHIMRMLEPGPIDGAQTGIQRTCAKCAGEANFAPAASLQAIEGGEEEPEFAEMDVQRKAEFGSAVAAGSPFVTDRLARTQSGGEVLASGTRHPMEAAFGWDFSRVRVHRDGEAAELSRHLSALAFTRGNHIYFGSGRYYPEGSSGRRLLAHELAHVVQQGEAAPRSGGDATSTATAVQTTPPAIQRVATWTDPVPNETNNLADTALNGVPAGVTAPMFNGAIGGALNGPRVNVTPVVTCGIAGCTVAFDATVATVPVNIGSVDETVLAPGPWRMVAPRATIGVLFPTLRQCRGAGNSNFRARGDPSDRAMFDANRRHEDQHATDRRDAFNGSVVPWDTSLTAARAAGTTFRGATVAAAQAALFAAMGGTAAQVTTACLAAGAAARDVYHATPAGGPVGAPTDPTAAADCSWSFARYNNPS